MLILTIRRFGAARAARGAALPSFSSSPLQQRRAHNSFVPLPPPDAGFRVYCDLDGVLCDFEKGLQACSVSRATLKHEPGRAWDALRGADNFFGNLEWLEKGPELWATLAPHTPVVLTGMPRGGWAEPQKRGWCRKNLSPTTVVITTMKMHKKRLAGPGNILIDDDARTCQAWKDKGGHAICYHPDRFDEVVSEFEELKATLAKPLRQRSWEASAAAKAKRREKAGGQEWRRGKRGRERRERRDK